jgi:hypothetical protein
MWSTPAIPATTSSANPPSAPHFWVVVALTSVEDTNPNRNPVAPTSRSSRSSCRPIASSRW